MSNSQEHKNPDAPSLTAPAREAFRGGDGLLSVQRESYEVWYARATAQDIDANYPFGIAQAPAREACIEHAKSNGATSSDLLRIRAAGTRLYIAGQYA